MISGFRSTTLMRTEGGVKILVIQGQVIGLVICAGNQPDGIGGWRNVNAGALRR